MLDVSIQFYVLTSQFIYLFQVKVTEIFDVTDCDSPTVQTNQEKEINTQLEFDDEQWTEPTWTPKELHTGK